MKLIWIGANFEPFYDTVRVEPLSLRPVHALYYNVPGQNDTNQIVDTISEEVGEEEDVSISQPLWPVHHTQRPNVDPNGFLRDELQWFYSEAPLTSVERVRLCISDGQCIGLRLQYKSHDVALGQYRLDKESPEWVDNPQWVRFQTSRMSPEKIGIQIQFSQHKPTDVGWSICRMSGVMCWWFQNGMSEISVVSQ
jgi:hypothetical protein